MLSSPRFRLCVVTVVVWMLRAAALFSTGLETPSKAMRKVRVLALHGSGGTASSFSETIGKWKNRLSTDPTTPIDLEITTVQGHVPKESGFAWWALKPGERSSTATTYDGFDRSKDLVQNALLAATDSCQPFDIVLGHSQGAILVCALLATKHIHQQDYPRMAYIFNGVAWPNPYTDALGSLMYDEDVGTTNVLVVSGVRDKMNPPEQSDRVAKAFRRAGCRVTALEHPRGHAVPTEDDETWHQIRAWIQDQTQQDI